MRQKLQAKIRLLTLLALTAPIIGCGESDAERREREAEEFATNVFIFLIICLGLGIWWWLKVQEKGKAGRAKLEKQQAQLKHRQAQIEFGDKWLDYFADNILVDCLVIDSNIWMNQQYDVFFKALKIVAQVTKFKIVLPGAQFDEICNIKKRTDYADQKNQHARLAISRIEQALKEDWLRIESISIDSDKRAYADPLLVKIIRSALKLGQRVCFISDDVELRIRIRAQFNDTAPEKWAIVEMQTLINGCEAIVKL